MFCGLKVKQIKMVKYVKIRLEDEIHLEFRKMCLEADTSMQQRLTDLVVKDIQGHKASKSSNRKPSSNSQPDEETNGHHPQQQVKIIKPRKHHKTYKGQTGELLTELAGNQVKVGLNGEEKAFYLDEIELVETE